MTRLFLALDALIGWTPDDAAWWITVGILLLMVLLSVYAIWDYTRYQAWCRDRERQRQQSERFLRAQLDAALRVTERKR